MGSFLNHRRGLAGRLLATKRGEKAVVRALAALWVLGLGAAPALSAEQPKVEVSGVVWLDAQVIFSDTKANGEPAQTLSSFDIGRIYLNATRSLSDDVKAYVQLEENQVAADSWEGEAKDTKTYLKTAYLEFSEAVPGHKLRVGLISQPWISFEEKIWKHRFVSQVMPQIEKAFSSVDRGVSLSGGKGRMTYELAIVNGEGKKNDVEKYKDFAARGSLDLSGASSACQTAVHLYLHKGWKEGKTRDRTFLGLSCQAKAYHLMGTHYWTKDDLAKGRGFSLHGTANLRGGKWVLARVDLWDTDAQTAGNTVQRTIIGLGHQVAPSVRGALTAQLQNADAGASRSDQESLHYTLEAKF